MKVSNYEVGIVILRHLAGAIAKHDPSEAAYRKLRSQKLRHTA